MADKPIVLRAEYSPTEECWLAYFTEQGSKCLIVGGGPGRGPNLWAAILALEKKYPNTWAAYEHAPLEVKK